MSSPAERHYGLLDCGMKQIRVMHDYYQVSKGSFLR